MTYRSFRRSPTGAQVIQRGSYRKAHDLGGGLNTLAVLRCPGEDCGRVIGVLRTEHQVDSSGTVDKPVTCKGCGTEYNVRLMDW